MTIDEIAGITNPAVLEAMSDAELTAHFAPYFKVTRPELAEKPSNNGGARKIEQIDPQMRMNLAKLAALGIDAASAMAKKRK